MSLLSVDTFELMKLWGELVEAYHGINGYGGDVAEIYAYRFQKFTPIVHIGNPGTNYIREFEIRTANQLCELLLLFKNEYECTEILVNGMSLKDYKYYTNNGSIIYDHKVEVTVIKHKLYQRV